MFVWNLLGRQRCLQAKRVFADRHGDVPIYGQLDEQSAIFLLDSSSV